MSLDLSVVTIAFPAMGRSFPGVSHAGLSWVLTAYAIVFAALLVPSGRVADRAGRRRVFVAGIGIFTVGSAACALAPTLGFLVGGRIVQGIGAALAQPASLGLLLGATLRHRQGSAVALWAGISALALIVSPTVGGLLIAGPGWRWIFTLNLPIGAVICAAAIFRLPESQRHPGRALPDLLGTALVAASGACLVLGLSEGSDWGWRSGRVSVALVVGAVLMAVVPWRSRHHPVPAIDLSLFRSRAFGVANLSTVLYATSFFGLLFTNVLFLTQVWRYTELQAGLAITPAPLMTAVVSRISGSLGDRYGYGALLGSGGAVMAASLAGYIEGTGRQPGYISAWLGPTVLLGIGVGLIFPVLGAAAVSELRADWAGASAVNQSCRQFGVALGIAAAVAFISAHPATSLTGYHSEWLFAAACAVASGGLGLLVGSRTVANAERSVATT